MEEDLKVKEKIVIKLNIKYQEKVITYRIPAYLIQNIYKYIFLSEERVGFGEVQKEHKKLIIDYIEKLIKKDRVMGYDNLSFAITESIHNDIVYHSLRYHKQKKLF